MHNAARRRHVGGVRYTIHFEIVGQGWEKGRKAVSFFRRIFFSALKGGNESGEPFSRRLPSPLDSIRACFLHMAAWLRSIGSGIWRRLATYPAIVEISTATDRQSSFRLHRVRQRDLKSFVLMNRIPWGTGARILIDWK